MPPPHIELLEAQDQNNTANSTLLLDKRAELESINHQNIFQILKIRIILKNNQKGKIK